MPDNNMTFYQRVTPQGKVTIHAHENPERFVSASPSDEGKVYVQTYGSRGWKYDAVELEAFALQLLELARKQQQVTVPIPDGIG